jgi:DNA-binding beta-propeller fold protein YncE
MIRTARIATALVLAAALWAAAGRPAGAQEPGAGKDTKGAKVNKVGKIDANHLVAVHGRPGGVTIDVFDPAARKVVANLAAFPEGVGVDHVAVSPDRRRVAFTSKLNNLMTLFVWNIFVIECETGALNQVTPDQATNEGLAKPLAGTGRAVLTGRLVWFDAERGGKSSSFLQGNVRIDGIEELAILGPDGTFRIENVPVVEPFSSFLLYARATLPRTSRQNMTQAQGQVTITVKPGETKDVGEIAVRPPCVDLAFGYPSWGKDGLFVSGIGNGYCQFAGYPKPKREGRDKSFLDWTFLEPCGVMASPDGNYVAGADKWSNNDPSNFQTARCIVFFDARTGRPVKRADLGDPNVLAIGSGHHGAWLPDSSAVLIPGWFSRFGSGEEDVAMAPCLYAATPAGQCSLAKVWKEAAGKGQITCIAPDPAGQVVYLVFSAMQEGGGSANDIWAWNRGTDATAQLTETGNVISIASAGR